MSVPQADAARASIVLLGDVATSFAATARSYDNFLAGINGNTSSQATLTSARDVARFQSLAAELRKQLADAQRVLDANSTTLQTRVEVTTPNGNGVFVADDFTVAVNGWPQVFGCKVEDVTCRMREHVRQWRDERRKAVYQEVKDLYENKLPLLAPVHDRARLIYPFDEVPPTSNRREEQSRLVSRRVFKETVVGSGGFGAGTLELFYSSEQENEHVADSGHLSNSSNCFCELIFTDEVGFKTVLPESDYSCTNGLLQHTSRFYAFVFGFFFPESGELGAERAKEKISRLSYWRFTGTLPMFHDNTAWFDLEKVNMLTDGEAADIVRKFETRWQEEEAFLFQFARLSEPSTAIERIEAIPFLGEGGEDEEPALIQRKTLLDLAQDGSIVEFQADRSILLRFHGIVIAPQPQAPANEVVP